MFAIDFHVIQEVQQQEQRPELNPDRALLACQVRQRFSGITLRSEADIASMISEMNTTIFGLDERRSQRRDTEIYSVGDVIMKFPNGIFGNSLDSGLTITPSKDATSGFKLSRVAV